MCATLALVLAVWTLGGLSFDALFGVGPVTPALSLLSSPSLPYLHHQHSLLPLLLRLERDDVCWSLNHPYRLGSSRQADLDFPPVP